MNILDTLRSYTIYQKRDSWANTGSQLVTTTTKTYTKGVIYKINYAGSVLNGGIVLALETYSSSVALPWNAVTIVDEALGYISFDTGVINPYFSLILTPAAVTSISSTPVNASFVPFTTPLYSILIPDEELDQILLEIGIPFIELEELEFSKQQIIDTMIKPVMNDYFTWFPKIRTTVYPMASTVFDIQVPEDSYGAHRVFVMQGSANPGATNAPANPLLRYLDEAIYSSALGLNNSRRGFIGRSNRGTLGNSFAVMSMDRAVRQGITNYAQRISFRTEFNPDNGKKHVFGFSLKTGVLNIEWALMSNLWSDIDYRRLNDVRKLATARILRALGMLRSQAKSDVPGTVDYTGFISRAQELEDKIYGEWSKFTKAAIVRS